MIYNENVWGSIDLVDAELHHKMNYTKLYYIHGRTIKTFDIFANLDFITTVAYLIITGCAWRHYAVIYYSQ